MVSKRMQEFLWILVAGLMILLAVIGFHLAFRFGPPGGPIAEIIRLIQWISGPAV